MVLVAASLAVAMEPVGRDVIQRAIMQRAVMQRAAMIPGASRFEPLQWLRYSSQRFQRLMSLLAERSARRQGPGAAPAAYPPPRREPSRLPQISGGGRFEPSLPSPPPGGRAQAGREPQSEDEEGEEPPHIPRPPQPPQPPQQRQRQGGEAKAGRHRPAASQAFQWYASPRHGAACRMAGLPVRPGGWYVVRSGDTLWGIARVHYGRGAAYPRIHRANLRTVPDPNLIYPCQRLLIPRWRPSRPPGTAPGAMLAPSQRPRPTALAGFHP